ncbi:hypothetical protein CAEBREN_01244 [Caenorhabditis brenneri]|uniref:Uncharacterized protein n=1 Tax=Caenorhabditis brenneri TaxID=135651 RepID=G0NAF1_CAEBE|nr:hypothetical protein CAEBREN_01244 [Caenorhabditis brenneri]
MSKRTNYPKSKEEVIQFWKLMQKALIQVGDRQIEFWELEDIVEMALELQQTKVWEVEPTYDKYPRMCVYLARVDLPIMEIVELHKRLRIQMDDCDREELESRGNVIIETDKKKYVLGAKQQ